MTWLEHRLEPRLETRLVGTQVGNQVRTQVEGNYANLTPPLSCRKAKEKKEVAVKGV